MDPEASHMFTDIKQDFLTYQFNQNAKKIPEKVASHFQSVRSGLHFYRRSFKAPTSSQTSKRKKRGGGLETASGYKVNNGRSGGKVAANLFTHHVESFPSP